MTFQTRIHLLGGMRSREEIYMSKGSMPTLACKHACAFVVDVLHFAWLLPSTLPLSSSAASHLDFLGHIFLSLFASSSSSNSPLILIIRHTSSCIHPKAPPAQPNSFSSLLIAHQPTIARHTSIQVLALLAFNKAPMDNFLSPSFDPQTFGFACHFGFVHFRFLLSHKS
ncbi:hypothetical protein QCA50_000597 [Cerrena zonata]|uniref:Uncharacterized protein n=1 Tax=Cerrena zonata TaxID=2478898 RepID=A0AAW0GY88_9APHY